MASAYVAMPTASNVAASTDIPSVGMCQASAVVPHDRVARVRLQVWLT
jgi:hypothetical protein